MTQTNFETIKTEILSRAKAANACTAQYRRALESETMSALMDVVKDNFHWACVNKVVTADLIERYREDFAAHDIFLNVNVERGYLLCNSATVTACNSARVEAYGSATVAAYDSARVTACGSATVEAHGSATVTAYDSARVAAYDSARVTACGCAYCTSYYTIECKLSDNAIYREQSTNTIYYASDEIKFEKRSNQQ